MSGIQAIDLVLGLIFIYLLISLLSSILNEIILTYLTSFRSKNLKDAILTMLNDSVRKKEKNTSELGDRFYEHPVVQRFVKGSHKKLPSYISRENFAKIVVDLLSPEESSVDYTLEQIQETIEKLPEESKTRKILLTHLKTSQGKMDHFRASLEQWYDDMMERVTGWYKRRVQLILFVIGFVLAVALNANTFNIAKNLSSDPEAANNIAEMASRFAESYPESLSDTTMQDDSTSQIQQYKTQFADLMDNQMAQTHTIVGMGWSKEKWDQHKRADVLLFSVFGWLLTALATTLGAPFWFDLLKKIVHIRNTGFKPEEKKSTTKTKGQ